MAAPTKQEMLDNVENAINTLMAGGAVQAYSIGGKNLERMKLNELMAWRKQLKAEIAASGGATTYVSFGNPS